MSEHPPKKPNKSGSRKTAGKETVHIVIVEDEKAQAELIRRGLLSFEKPFRLTVATTLEEARVVLADDPPDFMILDQLLPDGKGEDLLPENPGDLHYPVIVMTSHGDETLSEYLMQRGVADYFTKSRQVFDDLPHIIERTIRNWKIREEHQSVERELITNKSILETLINNPVNSIILLDRDGTILDLNGTLADRLGLNVSDAIGKCVYDLIPETLVHTRRPKIDKVFMTGVAARFEDERAGKWYDNFIQPVPDSDGTVIRVIINAHDITESKMAEAELRKREETWKKLFSILPIGVSVVNDENVVVDFNKTLSDILAMPKKSLEQKSYEHRKYLRSDLTEMPRDEFPSVRSLREHRTIRNVEIGVVRETGGVTWTEVSATPLSLSEKSAILVTTDITERKQAEEERRVNQSRLETAMEIGNFAWWEMDLPGGNVRFHDRKATFLGYPPQRFKHYTDFTDLLHPDDHVPAMRAMRDHLEGRAPTYDIEYRIRTENGTYRWFHDIGGITRRDSDGNPVTVTGIVVDITRTKEAELALRAGEEKYRFLVENVEDIVWQTTSDLQFTYLSPATQKVTGYAPTELIGTSLFSLMTEQSAGVVKERLNLRKKEFKLGKKELATVFEVELMKKNGGTLWLEISSKTVAGPDGALLGFQGINRDITIRKRAEEELKNSELRYRTLYENSGTGIITIDTNGVYLLINKQAAEKMGGEPEDIIGKTLFDFLPSDVAQHYLEKNREMIASGTGREYEETFELKTGSRTFLIVDQVIKNTKGEGIALQSSSIEITDRKRVDEALRESEERYRTLIDELPDYVLVHHQGELLYVNESGAKNLGYLPEDLLHTNILRYIAPDCHKIIREFLKKRNAGASLSPYEVKIITRDGSVRWVEIRGALITFEGQSASLNVLTDITEKKSAEKALADSELKFRTLADFTYDWEYWARPDGEFIYISPSCEQITGYTPEEFYRDRTLLSRIVYPDDQGIFTKHLETLETSPEKEVVEFRIIAKMGDVRWISHKCQRISGPDGENLGRRVSNQNITGRKQSEDALRSAHERLLSFVDANIVGVIIATPSGSIIEANDYYLRLIGYSREEFDNGLVDWRRLTPPEWIPADNQAVEELRERGVSSPYEKEYLRRDGKRVSIFLSDAMLPGPGEQIAAFVLDITERKEAEAALRESEEKYRILFNRMAEGNALHEIVYDPSGNPVEYRILDMNPSFEGITGLGREEVIGKTSQEAYGTVTPPFLDIYARVADSSEPEVFESYFEPMKKHFAISVYSPGKGRFATIFQDITERKLAESILRESEEKFHSMVDTSPDIIWEIDRQGNFTYISSQCREQLGYLPEELIGNPFFSIIRPESVPEITSLFSAHVQDNSSFATLEVPSLRRNGSPCIIEIRSVPIRRNNGDLTGFRGIARDITERKQAEVALLENKVRLATAMDVAELVDWDYDVASGMFMFDDRFYALYGTTAEREGGNLMSAEVYMREFVYPEDRPAVLAALRKILATTDPAYTGQVEHRITPRDGSIRTIIARFVPVIGPEGRVIRTYGANQDITDRKMMEEEVRSLNRVLEQRVAERTDQLNTSLDEKVLLLREIHHRVKNNLQIVASLFNLQSRYIVDQTALESIRETQNRVRAMALVHERIYRSENVGSIDLNEYLTFLGEQVFRYYGVKSSQITLSLSISAIRLDIDTAIPLGLVINEMLSNSLKHGFPDGRKGTISIACCECDQEISLVFSDDGIGFPEGLNWKNPPSLGLRLIISLVRQLKGKVELDPSPGTTFRITAPLVHYAKHEETGSMLN